MKATIAAGGTGGHVYPAVAVAAQLVARGDKVQWIGRPGSLEESEAKEMEIEFAPIPLQGLKRKWTWENASALVRFLRGRREAGRAMRGFQPDVVFALGSYVGAPAISAALSLRIPVFVHEQNVVPGLVVRYYAKRVTGLLLSKPLVDNRLKASATVVGMPLRPGIVRERTEDTYRDLGLDPSRKTLFLFGGSQGAQSFCRMGVELGSRWRETRPDWQILLQTGVANLAWTTSRLEGNNVVPVGHLREMGKAYACADVVVSRSGAVSCAELEAVGKPAVLVPYPFATADHQRLNAEAFVRQRAGCVIPQDELTVEGLEAAVDQIKECRVQPLNGEKVGEPVRIIVRALDEVVIGGETDGRYCEQAG
jgi:UDP-N-acetylglucosamine--N-acetylmuramyl-(pentapeptide) pyrophosphoryl-undecaprenol N-acetylglucosamine transferase